jgi:DNA invertase Pin-like site-specific DNA recombinase
LSSACAYENVQSAAGATLTLNALLSFAQFEREVTGERVRDKIGAPHGRRQRPAAG